jgi:RNA polymerase sigma-70 factor, ECF subfamily
MTPFFSSSYEELRRLARLYIRSGDPHTLQPTALVHEAFLKLVQVPGDHWQSPQHFTSAVALAMRQVLLDHARRKLASKRTPGTAAPNEDPAGPDQEQQLVKLLHVNTALEKLSSTNPELAQIIDLRYFLGCSSAEVAQLLNLQERTVRHRWGIAKVLLSKHLEAIPS